MNIDKVLIAVPVILACCPIARIYTRRPITDIALHWWTRAATAMLLLLTLQEPWWNCSNWGFLLALIGLGHALVNFFEMGVFGAFSPSRTNQATMRALVVGVFVPGVLWTLVPQIGWRFADELLVRQDLARYYDSGIIHMRAFAGQVVVKQQQVSEVAGTIVTNTISVTNVYDAPKLPSFDRPVLITRVIRSVAGTNAVYTLVPSNLNPIEVRTNQYVYRSAYLNGNLDHLATLKTLPVNRKMLVNLSGERDTQSRILVQSIEPFKGI